jgi:hypothetical protein
MLSLFDGIPLRKPAACGIHSQGNVIPVYYPNNRNRRYFFKEFLETFLLKLPEGVDLHLDQIGVSSASGSLANDFSINALPLLLSDLANVDISSPAQI